MANPYFRFKAFTVYHDQCAMKVTTDSCLFGAWCAEELKRKTEAEKENTLKSLLDIGTGAGLLSLMVAQKVAVPIEAVEIDAPAANQAATNVAQSPFKDQITVVQNDVLHLEDIHYDVILSNPPFYENELKSGRAAKDTAHHGHQLTWAELFAAINRLLGTDGLFYLLLPYKRVTELEAYVQQENLFINKLVIVSPTAAHKPIRVMVEGSRRPTSIMKEHLAIKDSHQQYTPEFTALLKDYYLYL
jgi:tRNA1Val (adenine37-N6)-methyltransferase